jgi:hypothetical protein
MGAAGSTGFAGFVRFARGLAALLTPAALHSSWKQIRM